MSTGVDDAVTSVPPLHTRRLVLLPLGCVLMTAIIDGDASAVASRIGDCDLSDWNDALAMLRRRRQDLGADSSLAPWVPRAIVRRTDGVAIGHINFHSAPDPDYLRPYIAGAVESGYTIFARYRRRGYATEALVALIDWAHGAHGVLRVALSVGAANLPSRIMAERLGFAPIGVWQDDEDGAEVVYAGSAASLSRNAADR